MANKDELETKPGQEGTPGDEGTTGEGENEQKPAGDEKEAKKPGKEAQKIVMDKATFDQIMANQAQMMKEMSVLRQAVHQGRLEDAENKLKPKELKRTFLKVLGADVNKPRAVIGWKSSPLNKIIRNPQTNLPVGEVLQAEYYFLGGGSSGIIEQVEFTRTEDVIHARVVKDISPTEWVIQFEDPAHPALVDEKGRMLELDPVRVFDSEGKEQVFENAIRINKAFCNP